MAAMMPAERAGGQAASEASCSVGLFQLRLLFRAEPILAGGTVTGVRVADVSRTIDSYAAFTISAHGEEDRLKRRRALPATKNEGGFLRRATLIWAHDRGLWPVRG